MMNTPRDFGAADAYENRPPMNVYSWCPEPAEDPNRKATQVHLVVGTTNTFVIRFKSAAAIDALIDALAAHREDVWGKR
jgi:hypothetical protein